MAYQSINFTEKLSLIKEHWSPRIIAQMNDYHFKLAKIKGEFVWHAHDDTDEVFVCIDGDLTIEFKDGSVGLGPGEMVVIPKGKEHRPVAQEECRILLIEPAGTVNTGDNPGEMTQARTEWI
ncbi:MAG: cupin domain-containing protein [Desulfobacteraceae bacterium]|nr:MAG: cupin domain-containing protein [Desulfobacteraceae bacterium]